MTLLPLPTAPRGTVDSSVRAHLRAGTQEAGWAPGGQGLERPGLSAQSGRKAEREPLAALPRPSCFFAPLGRHLGPLTSKVSGEADSSAIGLGSAAGPSHRASRWQSGSGQPLGLEVTSGTWTWGADCVQEQLQPPCAIALASSVRGRSVFTTARGTKRGGPVTKEVTGQRQSKRLSRS